MDIWKAPKEVLQRYHAGCIGSEEELPKGPSTYIVHTYEVRTLELLYRPSMYHVISYTDHPFRMCDSSLRLSISVATKLQKVLERVLKFDTNTAKEGGFGTILQKNDDCSETGRLHIPARFRSTVGAWADP